MYGNQYRPPARKKPLGRAKRMGQGKPASGAYRAGYEAAMKDMKARKGGPKRTSAPRSNYGEAQWSSYGEDTDQRGPLRIGWRI